MYFDQRLSFLIKDRKKTPWGKGLGFTSPSITAMFNGHIPGPEFLQAIQRAENVNLNWLLMGEGQPYIVHYHQTAEELASSLADLLKDKNLNVHICSIEQRAVLVVAKPEQYTFKTKVIDYLATQTFVGPTSEQLIELLQARATMRPSSVLRAKKELEAQQIDAIAGAKVGTYDMFGHIDAHLSNVVECEKDSLCFTYGTIGSAPVSVHALREVFKLVEDILYEQSIRFSNVQKARVYSAIYSNMINSDLKPENVSEELVLTIINAVRD